MYSKFPLILTIAILVMLIGVPVVAVLAAPQAQTSAIPAEDAFVAAAADGGSKDNYALTATWSTSPSSKPSRYIIMKFDLNAMTTGWPGADTIQKARLNVAALSCNLGDNVNVALFGMPDSFDNWTEGSLPDLATTETAAATSLVSIVDETTVNGVGAPGYYHWTDTGGGGFASWLQLQRTGGTYPGVVTLMLRLTGPNDSKVTFDDKEQTGKNVFHCSESEGPPTLQISGGGSPLSVTLRTFRSADPAVNWPLIAGGLVLIALAGGYGVYRWRLGRGPQSS